MHDTSAARRAISPTALLVFTALFLLCALSTAMWHRTFSAIAADAGGSLVLTAQIGGFVVFLTLAVLSLVRLPWLMKPTLALLVVCCAAAAYFINTYGTVIDGDMLRNALQTDRKETAGLLTLTLAGYVAGLGLLPAWLIFRTPLRWGNPFVEIARALGLAVLFLGLCLGSAFVDYKAAAPFIRNHGNEMRWRAAPLNIINASVNLIRDGGVNERQVPFAPIAERAVLAADRPADARHLVILVVGETARAANFSLNGYERPTNPELAKLPVVSFSNVASCGTATAISLPCMFSNLKRSEYWPGKAVNRENVLDLAKRAGYRVLWIDNQAGSKGVSDRVEFQQLEGPVAEGDEVSDMSFVTAMSSVLAMPDQHVLVVMHQMGSHGPEYFRRSTGPAKRFLPECREKQLERCEVQAIRNGYDNTIAQTDAVLAGLIRVASERGSDRAVSLLYASDHGESLGENGLYLHGLPYALAPAEQTHVPMIYWANENAQTLTGVSGQCARNTRDAALSHDNYFHTVLGLLGVDSDAYQRSFDAFADCRRTGTQ